MRTYRASTLPFSDFALTEFAGELRQAGVSAIELAQVHYSDVEAETIATLQEETGLHFTSMLSTVRVDAPDGLEALISILNTAPNAFHSNSQHREWRPMKPPLLVKLKRLLIISKRLLQKQRRAT